VNAVRLGRKIHKTNFRNEQAYFTSVLTVLQHLTPALQPTLGPLLAAESPVEGKLHVVGDSHCLSTAFHSLRLPQPGGGGDADVVMLSKLVTGLKCWHLRAESVFYPKRQFEAAVRTLPRNGDAMFLFGEIDCREGLPTAVTKGYHESLADACSAVIAVYVKVLLDVKKSRGLRRVFVHCPLPVIPVTRHLVTTFNRQLRNALIPREAATGLICVDVTDRVLLAELPGTPPHQLAAASGEKRVLRPEFVLDGTHINPAYVAGALQPAIVEAIQRYEAAVAKAGAAAP